MSADLFNKIKNLYKSWVFWLILISTIAIILRSIPAWTNAAWGCDFGIYFGLTKDFVKTGELYNPYFHWGSSYNFFPVLYSISGIAHWITGIDIINVMTKITPIFGGLSVLIFYFLIYELYNNKKIAILSSLFLAVLPFHVYQLSHASPLTIGHFFMILSLYFFVKYRKNTLYIYPLLLSTILLIMSHHLTTYFYLITLVFIIFFENASQDKWTFHLRKDMIYLLFTSFLVFSYWKFIATPVYESFMEGGLAVFSLRISSEIVIFLFYLFFFSSLAIAYLIRVFSSYLSKAKTMDKNKISTSIIRILSRINPFIKKERPSIKSRIFIFIISFMIFMCSLIYFMFNPLPWTGFPLNLQAIILIIPLVIIISLSVTGFRVTSYNKQGFFIRGWLVAISLSLLFSMVTNSNSLIPHRHFEYLMYPLAILAVFGIGVIFSDHEFKNIFSVFKNKIKLYKIRSEKSIFKFRNIAILAISLIVISNAVSVYPSHKAINKSWEEITVEDLAAIKWIEENIDKNNTLLVSDHRLERMIESEDYYTTQDKVENLWITENITEYFEEIYGIGKNHGKITHIIIDDIMKNKGVHIGQKQGTVITLHMTNETWTGGYDKFLNQPFQLIYRNESKILDQKTKKPSHWTEVYKINWTFISEKFMTYKN